MIELTIEDHEGKREKIEVPAGISLSLMEVLKTYGYPISATCGGIALCATCHVEVLKGQKELPPAVEVELQMLDMLPDALPNSRLACQLRLNRAMNGMEFRIMESRP
jgi:2Fe-2S ferredoxin